MEKFLEELIEKQKTIYVYRHIQGKNEREYIYYYLKVSDSESYRICIEFPREKHLPHNKAWNIGRIYINDGSEIFDYHENIEFVAFLKLITV